MVRNVKWRGSAVDLLLLRLATSVSVVGCHQAGIVGGTSTSDGGSGDMAARLDADSDRAPSDSGGARPGAGGAAGSPGSGRTGGDACIAAQENNSAQGCEFYSVIPPPEGNTRGSCFAAMVSNTWTAPITLAVDYAGMSLDVSQFTRTPKGSGQQITYEPLPGGQLQPGQMAILFLSGVPVAAHTGTSWPCPINPGVASDVGIDGSGLGHAFRITTSAPVAAYDIYPYGGSPTYVASATLLVPTSAWGTNYVAADGFRASPRLAVYSSADGPSVQIVAAQDGTNVTINPSASIVGGAGVAATAKGQSHTYALSKGQVLQFLQQEELAGSVISADKAVGVWGGSSDMDIPAGTPFADCAHQQLVPVNLLGFEYVAARHRDRGRTHESVPWTLIGAVDNTVLTYDPAAPAGAPTTVSRGQVFEFRNPESFTVRASDNKHPFYLAGHMTGASLISGNPQGDPETVNTVPPEQWLPRYIFLTDPTYKTTSLVFVRPKGTDDMFKDVTLDCLGTVTGWQPVGKEGRFEISAIDLITDGKPNGTCDNGVHTAHSEAAFGLTVWGWDAQVSYAYPAGMGVKLINTVVIP